MYKKRIDTPRDFDTVRFRETWHMCRLVRTKDQDNYIAWLDTQDEDGKTSVLEPEPENISEGEAKSLEDLLKKYQANKEIDRYDILVTSDKSIWLEFTIRADRKELKGFYWAIMKSIDVWKKLHDSLNESGWSVWEDKVYKEVTNDEFSDAILFPDEWLE